MAWTTPRTWTDGELVTKSIMDTHVRDNFLAVGPHLVVRKTSDETVSSIGAQNDDVLLMALAVNEVWRFSFNLLVSAAGTTDVSVNLTFPSGSISASAWAPTAGATVEGDSLSSATSPTSAATFNTSGTSVSDFIIIEGVMSNGGSAGNLQLQWTPSGAAAACTVKANSTLWAVKLA